MEYNTRHKRLKGYSMMKAITSMTYRMQSLFAVVAFVGLTGFAAEPREAWSSDWIEVTAANGVKDDYYPLQREPEKCSFRFRVMRNEDNTIGVEAFVRDDRIVTDDSQIGRAHV